ncbi:hypothetical protein ACIOUF_05620 [Pseudomonas iridis]|uniref:Helicase n=1 Tax=Pseudomonas iridis TaxID=2710587 RepID=A0ABW8DF42_9PSED
MHPEHFDLSSPTFLPVTEEVCASLLLEGGEKNLGALTEPELAAVLVIQHLAHAEEKDMSAVAAEKILVKLIAWAVDSRRSGAAGLLSEAQRLFNTDKLSCGLNALKRMNLRFLLPDEVLAQKYLMPNGKWDVGYKIRHHKIHNPFSQQMVTPKHRELWLSDAQDKLVRTFRANLDEDLHVQGYAGIGKSHLLGVLMECLPPGGTLVLARTKEKLEALRKRIGSAGKGSSCATFEAFARKLMHEFTPKAANVSSRGQSKQVLSQELNILGFQARNGQAALDVCLKVIELYCGSTDHALSAKHFPHFKRSLSSLDAKVLLEYSSRLWIYLAANPTWVARTELEALLMIKRASLAGCAVPARYTHILIDESQDIPASLLQIIDRGRQVLITLGDEYQHANRDVVKRKREVRQSDVCYSVRSGRNVERLVNPLICLHTEKSKIPFEGARDADIDIEIYSQGFVPPEGCVVLTASPWDTVKWAISLHDANCSFSFLEGAEDEIKCFMATAIALFKPDFYSVDAIPNGAHRYFSDMTDWQQVCDANQFDLSFLWVKDELEKGFKIADLTRLNRMIGRSDKCCMLMLAEGAGGMEFDEVLLTPELLTKERFKDAYEFDKRICAVYIAISRAKVKLYVPMDVVEWVDGHEGRKPKFRESHGY